MAKKTKLKLENFRVESFMTSLDEGEKKSLKGGAMAVKTEWLCPIPLTTEGYDCFGPISQTATGDFYAGCKCGPYTVSPY
jgi:hypothetical protein